VLDMGDGWAVHGPGSDWVTGHLVIYKTQMEGCRSNAWRETHRTEVHHEINAI
jgi:hypothetical protein